MDKLPNYPSAIQGVLIGASIGLILYGAICLFQPNTNKQTKTQMAIQVTIQKADGEIITQQDYKSSRGWVLPVQKAYHSLNGYENFNQIQGSYDSMNKTMHFTLTKIED